MSVKQERISSEKLAYMICANSAAGTGLLVRGLNAAGAAGQSVKYIDLSSTGEQLEISRMTTQSKVFGIVPSWPSACTAQTGLIRSWADAVTAALESQCRDVRYLWLKRRNKIAQSIARYRTSLDQSVCHQLPTARDFEQIDQLLQICMDEERAWETYFHERELRPLILVQEELVRSYQQTIHGVLDFVGKIPAGVIPDMPPAAEEQAMAIDWEQRYRASRTTPTRNFLATADAALAEHAVVTPFSYLICTEQRTGSTLLADALSGTGIAGTPDEYFTATNNDQYQLMRFGADNESQYVDRLIDKTSSSNGIFGVKVHWNQTASMRKKLTAALRQEMTGVDSAPLELLLRTKLQSPRYIWLRRKNKVAQAISFYRASRTGVWRAVKGRRDQGNVPDLALTFNADAIDYYVRQCQQMDFEWNHYFRSNRLTPLMIFYEDLIVNYELVVRGVLYFLGLPVDTTIPEPGLERQADERSLEWERWYRELRIGAGQAF
jgi:LPS sulfotransferase NodH